ncbi:IS110 family transposase, partial [candidate division KSB1 bacterium]
MYKDNNVRKKTKVNGNVLIVAVDIGKNTNTGYWRYPGGPEGKVFTFSNNRSGFELLMKNICSARRVQDAKEVLVGFESTGIYGLPLAHYLRNQRLTVVQVNPMHTKRYKEVAGNNRTKSDKKDPLIIADLIEMSRYLSVILPKGAPAHLRNLMQRRERILVKKNMSTNQLQDLMFFIFPEFLHVMKGIRSKSAKYFIEHYPFPKDIISSGFEEICLVLKKISRGKLGYKRALEFFAAAKQRIGIQEGWESIAIEIKQLINEIKLYNEFIQKIENDIFHYLKEVSISDYILSIKGIGKLSAAGIIGEVGDFESIRSSDSLIKLAGLNLCENSSGKREGKLCISKMGRTLLRKILFFAAINTVKKGGIMHDYYQKLIKKGKQKLKALVAVMRKLLRRISALVRNKTYYQENYKIQFAAFSPLPSLLSIFFENR